MSHLPSPKSKLLLTKGPDTRVSQPHIADCLDQIILCPGGHSHAFSDVYQHPWSLTVRCQYYIPHPTPHQNNQKIFSGAKSPPPQVENHCATRTSLSPCPTQLQTEARQRRRPFDSTFNWAWQEGGLSLWEASQC